MSGFIAYKGVNSSFCGCNAFKYEVGKTYEHFTKLELCAAGFHFCKELRFCFRYYRNDGFNRFLKVEVLGKVITEPYSNKYVTNKIKIISILSEEEINLLTTGLFIQEGVKKEWLVNGKLHKEDGPAVEYESGQKEWWTDGLLHREDGPAIEYADGRKEWYWHGWIRQINTLENIEKKSHL